METLLNPYDIEIQETPKIEEMLNYETILFEISKELIDYRKKNNLTQRQLANKLNVNQTMISKLESGDYNIDFKTLLNFSYQLENNTSIFLETLQNITKRLIEKENYKKKIKEKI